jgi:molecular chaperone HtpG
MRALFRFHDLGMLVTRDEFDARNTSSFPKFKSELFEGPAGKDYRERVDRMAAEDAERFLYQEFVRQYHAERVRAWIAGKTVQHLGPASAVASELDDLLSGLSKKFRKDLGTVCESHHLDDLYDLDKYNTSVPYGSNPQEAANLQYCAILLRTADLLHVTSDRAPSVTFRIVNPSDPKSIREWQKQMAVISVRPKPGVDKDGNVDPSAPMNTVEVHGFFTDPEGYFALTAYLNYAKKELRKSEEWVRQAKSKKNAQYEFPWRDIDESGLEAEGFIDKQFEFTLDQARILDLLTGRTLYNDTTVVLRELVQNCLDAIRVKWENESAFIAEGMIAVTWDSSTRVLTVRDNGTGMTQRVIDDHFLKVGSSLYQDEEFRKAHPQFSPISRFGIGVLSTFMISDEIEVTTCHPQEQQARTLSLRSLHGKYLVKVFDKSSSYLPKELIPSGTQITLRVRPSAELKDVEAILQHWIVFPRCKVTVSTDNGAPTTVGFIEPKEALENEIRKLGLPLRTDAESTATPKDQSIKVVQHTSAGVSLAYAVRWSDTFQEWAFFTHHAGQERSDAPSLGTCIEGVRVEFASPGYQDKMVLALANITGPDAPKTNVARSGIELTPERKSLLKTLYRLYCAHVESEVQRMQHAHFSLTWALGEATWLIEGLVPGTPLRPGLAYDVDGLLSSCAEIPCIALEKDGKRLGVSPAQLAMYDSFWTVDSAFFSSAETLLKEIPVSGAISELATVLGGESLDLPPGPYISVQRPRSVAYRLAFRDREVDRIVLRRNQRRADLRWTHVGHPPLWRAASPVHPEMQRSLTQAMANLGSPLASDLAGIRIAQSDVEREGLDGETAIVSSGHVLITPGSPYSKYLLRLVDQIDAEPSPVMLASYAIALQAALFTNTVTSPEVFVRQQIAHLARSNVLGILNLKEDAELVETLRSTSFKLFNLQAWNRGPQGQI